MPSTRFFSMLKKCLNLRFQPVIYLDLNYKHGHFFKFNTLVSRSKTTMTLTIVNHTGFEQSLRNLPLTNISFNLPRFSSEQYEDEISPGDVNFNDRLKK